MIGMSPTNLTCQHGIIGQVVEFNLLLQKKTEETNEKALISSQTDNLILRPAIIAHMEHYYQCRYDSKTVVIYFCPPFRITWPPLNHSCTYGTNSLVFREAWPLQKTSNKSTWGT